MRPRRTPRSLRRWTGGVALGAPISGDVARVVPTRVLGQLVPSVRRPTPGAPHQRRATFSLPERWIDFADRLSGHGQLVNDLGLAFFEAAVLTVINQSDPVNWIDNGTDVCFDTWDPRVTFTFSSHGTATVDVEHARKGLILTGHERRPVETT